VLRLAFTLFLDCNGVLRGTASYKVEYMLRCLFLEAEHCEQLFCETSNFGSISSSSESSGLGSAGLVVQPWLQVHSKNEIARLLA